MNIVRLKGDADWFGVDLTDNTLCRKGPDGKLRVIGNFRNNEEAARFDTFLERVAVGRPTRPTKWYEGWRFG